MAGRYLLRELGLNASDAVLDPLPAGRYSLFHLEGTDRDDDAERINLEGTKALLRRLEANPPEEILYLSSWSVYSPDAGESVDESRPTFAWSEAGRSRAQTELLIEKWGREHDVPVTVVRAARMFGKGIDGAMAALFARVVRGHYVHIRDNDAKTCAITALDAAKAMVRLIGKPGVFNLSDGRAHTWKDLCEAMTANTGVRKRLTVLPEKWARTIYRFGHWIPAVEEMLSEKALKPMSLTCVVDSTKAREATGLDFHDTLAVIAREDPSYPYEDE